MSPLGFTRALLADLGRPLAQGGASPDAVEDDAVTAIAIAGADPVLPTRFRAGEAVAAALLAGGVASADLWRLRGGGPQRLAIDVRAAAASLLSFLLQRAAGVAFPREALSTTALYRTRDGGWIHLHGGFPHLHAGTLETLGCRDDAAAIARAVAGWEAQALEDALAARGLCGARLRSAVEWAAHPQGQALAEAPLVELIRIGDAAPEPPAGPQADAPGARPLAGVRALDLTRVLAGPTCGRTLASHGASVLHVRSPRLPAIEPFVMDTNVGKRSCFLDLDEPDARAQLVALVREADVFCQSYRAGALARRGFGADALAALRPGIIVVSLDCYGHTGPWAGRPGWEQLAQTASGMAHEHGGTAQASIVPAAVTDYTTGHLAAFGAMTALARRAREGGSWHVRVSLARTAAWLLALPRTPEGAEPAGLDPAALVRHQVRFESPWGALQRLDPILEMDATPPRWDLPPVPLGHHAAAWA